MGSAAAALSALLPGGAAIALPLPWLAEPGTQQGLIVLVADRLGLLWIAAAALAFVAITSLQGMATFSRTSHFAAWAMLAATIGLAVAGNALAIVMFWELSAVASWAFLRTRIDLDDEITHRGGGQMLLTGLLMDSVLIGGSAAVAAVYDGPVVGAPAPAVGGPLMLFAVGMTLAAAGRCGLLPASGWIRRLRSLDRWTAATVWTLGLLIPAAILFSRAGALLNSDPESAADHSLTQALTALLGIVGLMALLSAKAQRERGAVREYFAMMAGAAMGVISMSVAPQQGFFLGLALIAVWGWIAVRDRFPSFAPRGSSPGDFPSQLERLAARDWGVPELWWSLIELPLRGIAQVSRFLDGFVFDQLTGAMLQRAAIRVARFGTGGLDDPLWLPALSLILAAGLLAVMTWS